jgi:hypothetical protein
VDNLADLAAWKLPQDVADFVEIPFDVCHVSLRLKR